MRWVVLLLALLAGACTNDTSAYMNATESFDSDFRRIVKQIEVRNRDDNLDWPAVERLTVSDIDRLRQAQKVFSQGPPRSEAMRAAAQDLIIKLVPALTLTHDLAIQARGKSIPAQEREKLDAMQNTAALALEVYDARRKEFSGG